MGGLKDKHGESDLASMDTNGSCFSYAKYNWNFGPFYSDVA